MPPFHHRGNHFAATGVPFSGRFFGEYGRGMSVRSQSQRTRAPRRGPRGEAGAARASILAAARALFLAGDFQSVSLRAVARDAGVDTSLVSYYFGSKQALYNEAMSLPNGPHRIIADVCSGTEPDHLGEALVKAFIDAWDGHLGLGGPDPQMQGVVQALLTQPGAFDMVSEFYTDQILAPVVELLVPRFGEEEAGIRASLGALAVVGNLHGALCRRAAIPGRSLRFGTHCSRGSDLAEDPDGFGSQGMTHPFSPQGVQFAHRSATSGDRVIPMNLAHGRASAHG